MVTEIEVLAAQTANGGWTKEQFIKWGLPWPPPRGWKRNLLKATFVDKSPEEVRKLNTTAPKKKRTPEQRREQMQVRKARQAERKGFYWSEAWLAVRYRALKLHGVACQCCGMRAARGHPVHVDHIKPRSKFPELALDLNNLQVLCEACNMGKSNTDSTDWRP